MQNYATATNTYALQQEKPRQWEAGHHKEEHPHLRQLEKSSCTAKETPCSQKKDMQTWSYAAPIKLA